MTDKRFNTIVQKTLTHEGGYVDDPQDKGGETNFGISKRYYPMEDIKNLTHARAIEIYRRDFWEKPKINQIKDDALAAKLFDLGVNMGAKQAVKLLQRAMNDLGASLADDGLLGPMTLSAVNGYPDQPGLLEKFKNRARKYYIGLNKPRFINGWLRRLES